jgi:predicted transcriptional regulator
MKVLTKAEEDIMQVLWQLKKANVKGIIEELPEPKPAYNTVSTIVRILEGKGFVDNEKKGKGHLYYPTLEKTEYSHQSLHKLAKDYFKGSFKSMVSFFMKKNEISLEELESILDEIHKEKTDDTL